MLFREPEMRKHLFMMSLLTSLAVLSPTSASGQTASPVPMSAAGGIASVVPSSEARQPNTFEAGVELSASYDSNVFTSSARGAHSDIRYSVLPRISLTKSLPRVSFDLKYSPGVEISEHRLYRSLFTNNADGGFIYTPTDWTSFSARQQYDVTTDPFRGLGGPVGALGQPSFLPNFKQTSYLSNASLSHRFSQFDTLGIGGVFADRNYENARPNQPTVTLIRSRIASGNAYFTHQLSPRNTVGIQYGAQALEFPQHNARTFTHSLNFLDVITFSSRSSLTLFAGPDYSLTSNQIVFSLGGIIISIPFKKNTWSASGGAVYSFQGERTAFQGQFSRHVSDGGGLLGAVYLSSGSVQILTRLTKNWDLDMHGTGAVENLIAANGSSNPQLLKYGAGAGFNRKLGQNFSMRFYYDRMNQSASNLNEILGNHNIGGVSLDIHFLRPLGR